jgi:hypothetical protein
MKTRKKATSADSAFQIQQFLFGFIGISAAFLICFTLLLLTRLLFARPQSLNVSSQRQFKSGFDLTFENREPQKSLVFVGMMTANKFVGTRCKAIYNTWAKEIPGKLVFFTSEKSDFVEHIPMIRLPRVDDTYPPQKKVFMMLKFMHDNYLDKVRQKKEKWTFYKSFLFKI